jgi:hypothetical protein
MSVTIQSFARDHAPWSFLFFSGFLMGSLYLSKELPSGVVTECATSRTARILPLCFEVVLPF